MKMFTQNLLKWNWISARLFIYLCDAIDDAAKFQTPESRRKVCWRAADCFEDLRIFNLLMVRTYDDGQAEEFARRIMQDMNRNPSQLANIVQQYLEPTT